MLRANASSIDTHLGGGSFGNLGVVISDIAYDGISPLADCVNPPFPGRAPVAIEGGWTSAQISANKQHWEEATNAFKTYNTVQSALKKHIIMVVAPMYIEIRNDDLVGLLTPLPDTCFTTSSYLMVVSQLWTLSRTLKTCAKHGTPIIRWKHYSSRFKIVLT
jgi:hypothetical protein